LIESAKLNGLDPQLYLPDVLARIADHPARRIAELLPWNWQPTRRDSRCRLSLPARRTLTRNHATRCAHWIPPNPIPRSFYHIFPITKIKPNMLIFRLFTTGKVMCVYCSTRHVDRKVCLFSWFSF
jgi:IS66 C-terminal element